MTVDFGWAKNLELDVQFGYLGSGVHAPRRFHPQVVLNNDGSSVLRVLREELSRCDSFTFSVAFVSPRGIALIKQELIDFPGEGRIVTSDYLAFNSPKAFAELLNLRSVGVDVRIHRTEAFHPKGYVFQHANSVTAMMGSSNLTESALAKNHEWNLKVTASHGSDLARQLQDLVHQEVAHSTPLTQAWIDEYERTYQPPPARRRVGRDASSLPLEVGILPNAMQRAALSEIERVRQEGAARAIVVSATGTGKTILSALDVKHFAPKRLLFVVHREQILDRTIAEYRRVLGGTSADYGKLVGSRRDTQARYLFATVQTLSRPDVLHSFSPDDFDYIIVDEAHRAGARTHLEVIGHFQPTFLLGMTATPERTDSFNVFELFDHTVPYEIRLNAALEADMLSPFHYYGIADVTFDDGTTTTDATTLARLVSHERAAHIARALNTYGQAGVDPRGLIFCSRREEAERLSALLNEHTYFGRPLRTTALTGADTVAAREEAVRQLEGGELDFILTVDVFNEGVDIPTLNHVVMLRQTQSPIVFVQQLGRGLRKAPGKDYLVVIDFIGNYANNFLIPVALFGDESLNKESLRQHLIAAEEKGVVSGLSSVRFDRISQKLVLDSIGEATLDNLNALRTAVVAMRNRVGGVPELWDFLRFESVDPVLLATKREHYPALIKAVLKVEHPWSPAESKALELLSHEVLPAKRLHEFLLVEALLNGAAMTRRDLADLFTREGLESTSAAVASAVATLTLEGHSETDAAKYGQPLAEASDDGDIVLTAEFRDSYATSPTFRREVDDLIRTGSAIVRRRFDPARRFLEGAQYSRKEVCRLLNWPRKWASTLYGYKADVASGHCPIFVTLHKADDIVASTAYEDEILDRSTMRWFTRSRRTLRSGEVRAIVDGHVVPHVFVKKDDAEGSAFYYLGDARVTEATDTTMAGTDGTPLSVVEMLLHFDKPIPAGLFDYFHPTVTA